VKVTVCEIGNDAESLERDWEKLVVYSRKESSDVVLLPELPFFPWPTTKETFSKETWGLSVLVHDEWLAKLVELAPATVLGTRPVVREGRGINEGFIWTKEDGYKGIHGKYYLPNEDGFWEATWYERGDGTFDLADVGGAKVGFLICSELWSMRNASRYGKLGAHLIASPRATGRASVDKWLAGGRANAVISGCFSISSNRVSKKEGTGDFGGRGWIVDPDGGVLAATSPDRPFATAQIDIGSATRAKMTYPRYCLD